MTKSLIVLITTIALSACASSVADWEMISISEKCKERGGISSINTIISVSATCGDGTLVHPQRKREQE